MKGDSYKDISFYYVTDNNNAKIYILNILKSKVGSIFILLHLIILVKI